ncbi:hypothetical protein HRbin15_00032 [bacterium HR15]|nr:hypothetical protein HRbin15_00032 [bacterium HR15]
MEYNHGMRSQPIYPSDPTPQEWGGIKPVLKGALYGRKRKSIGAPCQYSLYNLLQGMLLKQLLIVHASAHKIQEV